MKVRIILYCLILLCLSTAKCVAAKQDSHIQKAEAAYKRGNYDEACKQYDTVTSKFDSIYQSVYQKEAVNLRALYKVDELRLQNTKHQNRLVGYIIVALFSILFVGLVFILFLRKANKKLALSKINLEKARLLADESFRNKSMFLSNMSHEIRTPLNALSGFSDILSMDGIDDEVVKECKDSIEQNSELLLKLIKDVIDISCVDIGNIKYDIAPCDVVSLCRNVILTMNKVKHTQAEIRFTTELTELKLNIDSVRIQQVLLNLLVNASKFTKEGLIDLSLEQKGDDAFFVVTDTGCGIPLEQQERIFKRYERVNENIQGTGLGLSICQLIVKHFGGRIWIDPAYTQGSRFIFTLPIKEGGEL